MELHIISPEVAMIAYNEARELYEKEKEEDELPPSVAEADNSGINGHSKAQATTTAQQIYDWGEEECTEHQHYISGVEVHGIVKHECIGCWPELKKEGENNAENI